MSSMFDQALSNTRLPSADDVEISFPVRREPQTSRSDEGVSFGERGGAAAGPSTPDGDAVVVAAGGGDPLPQRDEPDDGEHTDSTEAEIAARVSETSTDGEPIESPVEAFEDKAQTEEAEPATEAPSASDPKSTPRSTAGSQPVVFQRVGFSAGAGIESLTVTRFPQVIVDELRLRLATGTGEVFADAISATGLLTAALSASLGVELDLDENTAAAAEIFRAEDPRMAGVEDRVDSILEGIDSLARVLQRTSERAASTAQVVDAVDYGVAYLIADRVSQITTAETTEQTVDVTQPKVLVARERVKSAAKKHRNIEQQKEGRTTA